MSAAGFAEARGDLAQALVPHAAGLVVAVREETRPEIRARLVGLSRTQLEGLAVVLAAMVDPERSLREALGWVDFDEYGDPAPRVHRKDRTIRDAAPQEPQGDRRAQGVDMVAVGRALVGHRTELNRTGRMLAVDMGIRGGLGYDLVAERLGMNREAVQRSWERLKARAREQGLSVPQEPVNRIGQAA